METKKPTVILTGLQPSADNLHLGNYFGSLKPLVDLQNDKTVENKILYLFCADLHTITVPTESGKFPIAQRKNNLICTYAAAGIDLTKTRLFYQSDVPAHTSLGWVLICHSTLGELSRMTQYKDKSNKQEKANGTQMIPTGLLVYPPLMAADILLYDADLVPVGKDQKQHVELTRDLAIKFNKKYGETFNLPEYYATKETAVIYDLVSPEHKMSKSNPVKGTIFLTDSVEEITKKITASITDCDNKVIFDEKKLGTKLGGISNLMIIYKLLTNMDYKDQEAKFANIKNYGEFKKEVIAEVVSFLTKFQKEYKNAQDNIESLKKQIEKNAEICREISNKKIEDVYKKIGVK